MVTNATSTSSTGTIAPETYARNRERACPLCREKRLEHVDEDAASARIEVDAVDVEAPTVLARNLTPRRVGTRGRSEGARRSLPLALRHEPASRAHPRAPRAHARVTRCDRAQDSFAIDSRSSLARPSSNPSLATFSIAATCSRFLSWQYAEYSRHTSAAMSVVSRSNAR